MSLGPTSPCPACGVPTVEGACNGFLARCGRRVISPRPDGCPAEVAPPRPPITRDPIEEARLIARAVEAKAAERAWTRIRGTWPNPIEMTFVRGTERMVVRIEIEEQS